jgi:hypothetical protein
VWRARKAETVKKGPFEEAILRNGKHIRTGACDGDRQSEFQCRGRNVLELDSDGIAAISERPNGCFVFVVGSDLFARHLAGRAALLGREDDGAIPHAGRRHDEHAAELSPAEDSDSGAGQNGLRCCHEEDSSA